MPEPITYKCVICGAELESIGHGMGKCPSCKFRQSMPTISSLKLERANKFRRDEHDFQKALKLYNEVSEESSEEADAFWGAAICKYGVEFVNDENDNVVPTFYQINKFRFSRMQEFGAACEKADDEQKSFYENTASRIDDTHRKIIDVFAGEKFSTEVYIRCCTDEDNEANEALKSDANKLAAKLRGKDYKVFCPDTKDNIEPGTAEYESYAYNGLSTAGVMLIIGNKPENFVNKWVKNEWTRFSVMHKSNKKALIIPIVFDMDPYELPMELQSTQAINWHSAEAMDLVLEAVDKAMGRYVEKSTREKIEKINDIIDAKDKEKADQLYELALKKSCDNTHMALNLINQILDTDPEYHKAYWLRLCINMNAAPENIEYMRLDLTTHPDYISAVHHADDKSRQHYESVKDKCLKNLSLQQNYNNEIKNLMNSCCSMQNSQIIDIGKKTKLEQSINNTLNSDVFTSKMYSAMTIATCAALLIFKIIFMTAGFKIGNYLNSHDSMELNTKSILMLIGYYVVSALYYILLLANIKTHQFNIGSKTIGLVTGITQIALSIACSATDFNGIFSAGPLIGMPLKFDTNTGTGKSVSFWNFVIIDLITIAFFAFKLVPTVLKENSKKKKRIQCENEFKEYRSLLTASCTNLENAKKSIFEKYTSMKDSPECILEQVTDKSFDIICSQLVNSYDGKFKVEYSDASSIDF